uniref:Creatinase_N domain-containing protein n=1 Tax=Globodera pallida TaxID=36090 RepID=A0A183CS95_GLOPA
ETERGEADADYFLIFGAITKHLVIIVTDKHVIVSRKHKLTENWSADWRPGYAELKRPVRVDTDGKFKEERRLFSLFSKCAGANVKLVKFSAEDIAQRVFDHMLRAWKSGAEE